MSDEMENAVKIAVLAEQVSGLREQHKAQAESMLKKVDDLAIASKEASSAIMTEVGDISKWMLQNHEVPKKVTVLWDAHSNTKGFMKASSMVAGAIGGGIMFVADKIFK